MEIRTELVARLKSLTFAVRICIACRANAPGIRVLLDGAQRDSGEPEARLLRLAPFETRKDTERLGIAFEAVGDRLTTELPTGVKRSPKLLIERVFSRMAEGRMAQVVREPSDFSCRNVQATVRDDSGRYMLVER